MVYVVAKLRRIPGSTIQIAAFSSIMIVYLPRARRWLLVSLGSGNSSFRFTLVAIITISGPNVFDRFSQKRTFCIIDITCSLSTYKSFQNTFRPTCDLPVGSIFSLVSLMTQGPFSGRFPTVPRLKVLLGTAVGFHEAALTKHIFSASRYFNVIQLGHFVSFELVPFNTSTTSNVVVCGLWTTRLLRIALVLYIAVGTPCSILMKSGSASCCTQKITLYDNIFFMSFQFGHLCRCSPANFSLGLDNIQLELCEG